VRHKIVNLAPKETKLSPRELAVTFSDQERSYASDATVYRVLKASDLIASPEVAAAELSIENERVKVAKARETATSEAAAVKQASNIKINSANLIRVVGQSRYCDAASFFAVQLSSHGNKRFYRAVLAQRFHHNSETL
jgi:hypothetical protein